MSRIRLLPPHLVNRIAAGEVIERPAAVLKELAENAVDAGADRIEVMIENGGIDFLSVKDNGNGMSPEDLKMAVLPHATSKLQDDGLVLINTLGFRGEALPSIGAAARLRLISRRAEDAEASEIRVEGGLISETEPAAGAIGTTAQMRDLFFATPARRKFLKTAKAEREAAEQMLKRLAAACPQITFTFYNDSKKVFHFPAESPGERAAALFGKEATGSLLSVVAETDLFHLNGFIAAPNLTKATAAAQYFTVNGRFVADPLLKTALKVAFRDFIPGGRHPLALLSLTLPPEEIDQNVHPAKTELRFRDPNAVRGFIIRALRQTLSVPAGQLPEESAFTQILSLKNSAREEATAPKPFIFQSALPKRSASGPLPSFLSKKPEQFTLSEAGLTAAPAAAAFGLPPEFNPFLPPSADEDRLPLQKSDTERQKERVQEKPQGLYPLGAAAAQIFNTYILSVTEDNCLIITDQHAAHERLTEEKLKAGYAAGEVKTQFLLLPAVIELNAADIERLQAALPDLTRLGFEIDSFGQEAVLVRGIPVILDNVDPLPLIKDLTEELAESGESITPEAKIDALIGTIACHHSIRAGRKLTPHEMNALLRQMEQTPGASTCSHGRPTYLKLSQNDIEKLFGRR